MTFVETHRQALSELQDELQALKVQHGAWMRIEKGRSDGPFPIKVTVSVPQPPPEVYDCDSLQVLLILDHLLLEGASAKEQSAGLTVEIGGEDLPSRLRRNIANSLQEHWRIQRAAGSTSFGLASIFDHAAAQFVTLITCVPELLERYEGVDEAGATVRRVAIINDDAQVSVDASVQPQQPQPQEQRTECSAGTPSQDTAAALQPAQRELTWLQRRYGLDFRPLQQPISGGDSVSGSAEQPQPLPSSSLPEKQQQHSFALRLMPTDPTWARGPLQLSFTLASGYPAAGSLAVTSVQSCPADPSGQTTHAGEQTAASSGPRPNRRRNEEEGGWSDLASEVLAKLLTAEASGGSRGRPGHAPLIALVRSVDSHATQHVQQAEDLALEVAAKRRKAAASASSSLAGDSPAQQRDAAPSGSTAPSMRSAAPASDSAQAQQQSSSSAGAEGRPVEAERSSCHRHSLGVGLWWPSGSLGGSGVDSLVAAAEDTDLGSSPRRQHRRGVAAAGRSENSSARHTPSTSDDGRSWSDSALQSGYSDGGGSSDDGRTDSEASSGTGGEGRHSSGRTVESDSERIPGSGGGGLTAVALELLDLSVDNVDVIEPHSLRIQVLCARCRRPGDVALPAGDSTGKSRRIDVGGSCAHCHHDWQVGVRGAMVHETSSVLAQLWPVGCIPTDLLPSLMAAQCAACTSIASFRCVQVGTAAERDCSHCHRAMKLRFTAVAFTSQAEAARAQRQRQQHSERGSAHTSADAGKGRPAGGVLAVGQPLPDLGTCRHYAHSHRWLRFPCCGARFPCDLCHEEGTDGHEMKWATRQVCGFCSTEQPLGDRCSACDKRLASSARKGISGRSTRFWEGGKGCRDPTQLDRRDRRARKQRGQKTQSQKDKRVGVEAKKRREQAKAR